MRDTIILGMLSGLIGNVAKDASNYIIYRAGKTEMLYGHFAASMITDPAKTHEAGNFAVGQLIDMTVGALMGVPLVYLFKKTGKDHYLLKGAGLGLMLWGILYGIGPNLNIVTVRPRETKTHVSALFNNLLYGLTTAQAAVSLADPDMFSTKRSPSGCRFPGRSGV